MLKKLKTNLFPYLIFTTLVIVVGISLGYHQITPTKIPKELTKEADYRSTFLSDVEGQKANFNMTMHHLYEMAQVPHPSGSDAIEKVQTYLAKQLDFIGCDYEVQPFRASVKALIDEEVGYFNEYISYHPEKKEYYEKKFAKLGFSSYEEKYRASIHCSDSDYIDGINYFIKIDAPNTDKGVLFVSHYDSTQNGPGAGDDLISVTSMLEALRDVKTKNKLTNDMYFLFTDSEELDLFGASAFIKEHPDMVHKIDLVINSEARGTSGTMLMFQTSDNNKGIVNTLNQSVKHCSAFSFFSAVYKTMPNDTDLTEFLKAGYKGMNFAMIGSSQNYHGETDNFNNLDRNSAYMYFRTTVDLAQNLSTADLSSLKSKEDAVYFPFLKNNTFVISNSLMFHLSIIVGIITLVWIGILFWKKETHMKDLLKTSLPLFSAMFLAAILGLGGSFIFNQMAYNGNYVKLAEKINLLYYFLCFLVIAEVMLFIYYAAKKVQSKQTLCICGIIFFNLLNWLFLFLFNSLAYLFTIPLFLLFLYSLIVFITKGKRNYLSYLYAALLGLTVLILFTPIPYLLYTALFSTLLSVNTLIISIGILPIGIVCTSVINNNLAINSL